MLANKHFLINEMRSGLGSVLYHYIVRSEWGSFPNQALKIFSSCVCVYPQKMGLEESTVSTRLDGRSEDYKVYWTSGYWECWSTLPRDHDPSLKLFISSPVVLEKTLESPLDCKEIQPLHPKGTQPSIFTGRTDTEAELQYFGHLMWRTDSLEKILMLGKFDARRRKGRQRMRWLDGITGYGFERTLRDSEGHGSLMCCSPWGCKLSDTTEWLNNNNISSPGLSRH